MHAVRGTGCPGPRSMAGNQHRCCDPWKHILDRAVENHLQGRVGGGGKRNRWHGGEVPKAVAHARRWWSLGVAQLPRGAQPQNKCRERRDDDDWVGLEPAGVEKVHALVNNPKPKTTHAAAHCRCAMLRRSW